MVQLGSLVVVMIFEGGKYFRIETVKLWLEIYRGCILNCERLHHRNSFCSLFNPFLSSMNSKVASFEF